MEVLELLIGRGANFKVPFKHGPDFGFGNQESPLHVAAKEGNVEIIKLLIDKGADLNAKGLKYQTPLHMACPKDEVDIMFSGPHGGLLKDLMEDIVGNGANQEAEKDRKKPTKGTSVEAMKLLIDSGADLEAKCLLKFSEYGYNSYQTALHIVSEDGHPEFVKLLIDNGANVNARDMDESNGRTPLHDACDKGHVDVVKILLDHGASLEAKDPMECTALHCATASNSLELVKLLLDRGANVEAKMGKEHKEHTPILAAYFLQQGPVLLYLLNWHLENKIPLPPQMAQLEAALNNMKDGDTIAIDANGGVNVIAERNAGRMQNPNQQGLDQPPPSYEDATQTNQLLMREHEVQPNQAPPNQPQQYYPLASMAQPSMPQHYPMQRPNQQVIDIQQQAPMLLGSKQSIRMKCLQCHADISTSVKSSFKGSGWILLSMLIPFLPVCLHGFKRFTHKCPNCKDRLGSYEPPHSTAEICGLIFGGLLYAVAFFLVFLVSVEPTKRKIS